MRMLLILIALAIIVLVIKRLWLQPRADSQQRRHLSGQMVQCQHCGIYVPEQEAVQHEDQWYCSQEHLQADRRGD